MLGPQNYGIVCLAIQKRSENGFKMHRSLQIYIERTYGKTQSAVLGRNPRHHRFFVTKVVFIFRLITTFIDANDIYNSGSMWLTVYFPHSV